MEETSMPPQETAPQETAPQETDPRVTIKNPKKVAAGQKGAAVRKAKKQEALLEQLKKTKEGLRPSQTAQPAETAETVPRTAAETATSNVQSLWIVYAVLAAVAVGGVLYAQKSAPPSANRGAQAKAAPEAGKKEVLLDERPDPFHMQ